MLSAGSLNQGVLCVYSDVNAVLLSDLEGTLIENELLNEIAEDHGLEKEISSITEKGIKGEIPWEEGFYKRIDLLKNKDIDIEKYKNQIKYKPGIENLIKFCHDNGIRIVIISGGFDFIGEYVKKEINADFAFCNKMIIENGIINGAELNVHDKSLVVDELSKKYNLSKDKIISIDDGANGLTMLKNSGLGIFVNHKKEVFDKINETGIEYAKDLNEVVDKINSFLENNLNFTKQ